MKFFHTEIDKAQAKITGSVIKPTFLELTCTYFTGFHGGMVLFPWMLILYITTLTHIVNLTELEYFIFGFYLTIPLFTIVHIILKRFKL